MILVKDVMISPVITGDMDSTIGDIYAFFKDKKINHLPIVDGGELVGLISNNDVLLSLSPYLGTAAEQSRDADTAKRPAHQIMTRDPVCIQDSDKIELAAQKILQHGVFCLPVVDASNQLCGIISWKDILRHFINDHRGDSSNPLSLIDFKQS